MNKLTEEQINKIYLDAKEYFNNNHPELECEIKDNNLVLGINWKDTTYFNGSGLAHEYSHFKCIVKVLPNGQYHRTDVILDDSESLDIKKLQISRSGFSGKIVRRTIEFSLGKDNRTGEKGLIKNEFSTSIIQKPIKEYFSSIGLKEKKFSYRLIVKALPMFGKVVMIVLLSLAVLIFGLISLFSNDYPGLLMALFLLLIEIYHIYCFVSKD